MVVSKPEIVFLTEERHLAELITPGAYASRVKFTQAGIKYDIWIPNDEFEYIEGESSDPAED